MISCCLRKVVLALVFASLAPEPSAQSSWAHYPGTGHYYLPVYSAEGLNWARARRRARALGGDLVSITSEAENAFVYSLVSDEKFWKPAIDPVRRLGPWLGALQLPGPGEPTSGWFNADGDPWAYENWAPGEPNNWLGYEEDRLHFFVGGTELAPTWNDLDGYTRLYGFVVESETPPNASYIPFGVGCVGLVDAFPTLAPVDGGIPAPGTTSVLRFSDYPTGTSIVYMTAGLSNMYQAGLVSYGLPFELGALAPGLCRQLVSIESVETFLTTGPTFDYPVSVPPVSALIGATVHLQAWGASGSSLAPSNGVSAYIR